MQSDLIPTQSRTIRLMYFSLIFKKERKNHITTIWQVSSYIKFSFCFCPLSTFVYIFSRLIIHFPYFKMSFCFVCSVYVPSTFELIIIIDCCIIMLHPSTMQASKHSHSPLSPKVVGRNIRVGNKKVRYF